MKKEYFYPAMLAGISLIIMAIVSFFSYGYVFRTLILPGNAIGTLEQLVGSKQLFTYGLIGWSIIIVTDLIVTWAFYMFLKNINPKVSLIGAAARLTYTVVLSIAVSKLINVNSLIANITEVTTPLASEVMTSIDAFENIWSLGLIIFGVHLVFVGYVALQSKSISRIISILLIIAGVSYSVIHLLYGFLPQFDAFTNILETVLLLPMTVGELGFGIWLLINGRKLDEVI